MQDAKGGFHSDQPGCLRRWDWELRDTIRSGSNRTFCFLRRSIGGLGFGTFGLGFRGMGFRVIGQGC